MIITVIVPDANEDTYEQLCDALAASGIERLECHMQTEEQHEATPLHTLSPGRSTQLRPGETHAQAMDRLTEGADL